MKTSTLARVVSVALLSTIISVGTIQAAPKPEPTFDWVTVVNNNDTMPGTLETLGKERTFNSYNQPSVNLDGLVVFRARSKGGDKLGPPTHGIYTRDMFAEGEIVRILDRTTEVPGPNNLGTTFVETPSFPRIDMGSATIATRGNHPPVYEYEVGLGLGDSFTKGGTTGIYTNPFGELITGAGKLGNIGDFYFFEVPYELPGTLFEVFPGSPSVTNVDTIVFKGNYTAEKGGRTGVYYRQLDNDPAGGISPVVLIANNTVTLIPGTQTFFGSTSPPSAANGLVVFAGFDNEQEPTLGGIYLAPLQSEPELTTLVHIGGKVSGERGRKTFNGLGEGGAFDGRFVGFWGAWGEDSKTVRLYCPTEGNKDRIAYCNRNLVCEGAEEVAEPTGDTSSICDYKNDPNYGISCYQEREVPVNQGLFVHDINTDKTWTVAKTGKDFNDFLYWNFSGMTPCKGSGHHSKAGAEEGAEDDGEPARWRSSAFITVAGKSADFNAAFKARTGELDDYDVYTNPVDGIYLKRGGPSIKQAMVTVLDTTMEGQILDPDADGWTIMELGIEREGLRGEWLTINAKMGIEGGTEEEGLAGIYLTKVPKK
jgi:hypothetical protein